MIGPSCKTTFLTTHALGNESGSAKDIAAGMPPAYTLTESTLLSPPPVSLGNEVGRDGQPNHHATVFFELVLLVPCRDGTHYESKAIATQLRTGGGRGVRLHIGMLFLLEIFVAVCHLQEPLITQTSGDRTCLPKLFAAALPRGIPRGATARDYAQLAASHHLGEVAPDGALADGGHLPRKLGCGKGAIAREEALDGLPDLRGRDP